MSAGLYRKLFCRLPGIPLDVSYKQTGQYKGMSSNALTLDHLKLHPAHKLPVRGVLLQITPHYMLQKFRDGIQRAEIRTVYHFTSPN